MKNIILLRPVALVVGTLLVFPALYFIVSACLNAFAVTGLWKAIAPILDNPENKQLGLNAYILIFPGPLLAIIINLPQVLHLHFSRSDEQVYIYLTLLRHVYSWVIVVAATLCLAVLFFYLLTQTCV